MAKSLRSKREKRLRAIRREIVEPFYDKKEAAKLAAQEAALAAPKLPVRAPRNTAMEAEASTPASTSNIGLVGNCCVFVLDMVLIEVKLKASSFLVGFVKNVISCVKRIKTGSLMIHKVELIVNTETGFAILCCVRVSLDYLLIAHSNVLDFLLNLSDVEMGDGSQSMASLKPAGGVGKKLKKKFKMGKRKNRGKGKIRRKHI
ncbi:uncharacterized protein G2W53_005224 [Senna tora]|uniref:Uncharacterized protein n=1 Tax=Senna tora TaxID=362788 RepID=A0A835CIX1_9FABA|nr:uncharacterized protein G2W53_005224 [Senna tora]